MCGIIGVFDLKVSDQQLRSQVLEMSKKYGIADLIGRECIAIRM